MLTMKEKEIRAMPVVLTRSEGSRTVEGYAAVVEEWSGDLGGFKERIKRGAFDGVIAKSDVLALLNHDIRRGVLARSVKGDSLSSLRLEVDERGLKYSFEAPNTQLGDELLESIDRGDIRGSSFAFWVEEDTWSYGDEVTREITKIEALCDVSPVYNPAYSATTVSKRCLEMVQPPPAQEDKKDEVVLDKDYYNQFKI